MNSLSWMIYLADVAGGASKFLAVLIILSIICLIGGIVASGLTTGGPAFRSWHDDEDKASIRATFAWWQEASKKALRWAPRVLIVAFSVQMLIPASVTIYAIAASEYGEEILKSPTADKAVKALDAWLDRQIAGESEK